MRSSVRRVSDWAVAHGYDEAAEARFLRGADCRLVAHALAHNHVIVTHEVRSGNGDKVKIPNACDGLGLSCINPFQMLRQERARFVLAGPADID